MKEKITRQANHDQTERPKTPIGKRAKQESGAEFRKIKGTLSAFGQEVARRFRWFRRRIRRVMREARAQHFPESDRLLVQWVLLCWGLLPLLGSLLRERLKGRRKQSIHRTHLLQVWDETLGKVHPVIYMVLACALASVVLYCSFYTRGTTVTYDGRELAKLPSKTEAEAVRKDLEEVTTQVLGETFAIDDSLISYSSGMMLRKEIDEADDYAAKLTKEIGLVARAYCLYINGARIGATPYEGALEELLEQLQKSASNENTISCTFSEEVEIRREVVPADAVMNLGYIAELLYSTKTAEVTYEVKRGDTWSQITKSHGLTTKELQALNPGYNINKLQIGEVLTLSASVPYLTMTVVERESYVDDLAFDVVYTDSADMYQGDYKVTSKGEYGKADVVATVTYVNGEEIDRTILSSVTLKEPVTEYRLQGTKPRPTWLPTGSFRWPCTGKITSTFGGRKSPGGIGSTNHKGIDIAAPKGTPVYAADGGTVTYSGWMSGYGYLVQINHGNGYVTYYGHNSSLLVKVGQHVYKGQQIAKVGSTGNSTGNHCHFEVRYNGVAKNPKNYLH